MIQDPNDMHLLSEEDRQNLQRRIMHVRMQKKQGIPYSSPDSHMLKEWSSYYERWHLSDEARGKILQPRALQIAKWMNEHATGLWSLRMEGLYIASPENTTMIGGYRVYDSWYRIALRYGELSDVMLAKLSIR